MALVFLGNTLCCATILALTFYKRLHYTRLPAPQVVVGAKPSSGDAAQATGSRKRNGPRGFKPVVINNPAYGRLQPSVPLLDEWRLSQRSS